MQHDKTGSGGAMGTTTNPRWWNDTHASGWNRVKEAMKRDWEQTKADFSKKHGQELNQNVGDTVKQMAGKEAVPPMGQPNVDTDWNRVEPAMRYGYGARNYYEKEHADWDDNAENKLKREWNDLKTGRTWDEVKAHVRHGWDSAKRKM